MTKNLDITMKLELNNIIKGNRMKVIIRADASIYIGSGHVMRCLVLAQSLRNKGHQVTFASRPQQGDLLNFIRNKYKYAFE